MCMGVFAAGDNGGGAGMVVLLHAKQPGREDPHTRGAPFLLLHLRFGQCSAHREALPEAACSMLCLCARWPN